MLKMLRRIIVTVLFLFISGTISLYAKELESESGKFSIIYPEENERQAKAILNAAEKAKIAVEKELNDRITEKVSLLYAATEKEFFSISGNRQETILAYAISHKKQIIINGEAFKRQSSSEIFRTMVHEYAHIYLGLQLSGEIPKWLNEGLVMHLAGEWSFYRTVSVYKAHAMGTLLPLRHLDTHFPGESENLHLAYNQSYMITDYLIKSKYGGGKSAALFIEYLSDQTTGKTHINDLWDPDWRDAVEINWKASLGKRVWNFFFLFTSGSIFWGIATILFILAYLKKRKAAKIKVKRWEKEENVYSSLSKKDEEEFWTPEEDNEEKWRGDVHQDDDGEGWKR